MGSCRLGLERASASHGGSGDRGGPKGGDREAGAGLPCLVGEEGAERDYPGTGSGGGGGLSEPLQQLGGHQGGDQDVLPGRIGIAQGQ